MNYLELGKAPAKQNKSIEIKTWYNKPSLLGVFCNIPQS